MKVVLIVILTGIIFFFCFVFKVAKKIAKMISEPHLKTDEEGIEQAKKSGDYDFYDTFKKEDFTVANLAGYILHCQLCKNYKDSSSRKYVIISHGHKGNRYMSIKYAVLFQKLGFNTIIYDLRGHGLNEKAYITFGAEESEDLCAIIKEIRKKIGQEAQLGVMGESMGAATSIQAAAMCSKKLVDFCIADCAFKSARGFARIIKKNGKVLKPWWLTPGIRLYCKIFYHYDIYKSDALAWVSKADVPMLFVHGDADKLIPCSHCKTLYDALPVEPKAFVLFPGAKHAESILSDKVRYEKVVSDFLAQLSA